MRFGILKAGKASRATRARVGDYDRQFTDLLAQPGQRWEAFDVLNDEFPAGLDGFDGLAITGSPACTYDDEPWIHRLMDTLREAYSREIPLLGICFGAQSIAQALGGTVSPNPNGWDLGIVDVTLTEAGRRWAPLLDAPQPLRLLQTHMDIISRLPPGAVVLGESPRTPVEIFTLGERVLGLQGHPEMGNEEVQELCEKRAERGLLDPERAAEGIATLGRQAHREFVQRWLQTYLREGRLPAAA